jgi:hypothetical protein
MKDDFHQLAGAVLAFLIGLTPAALGAAVTLAYEKGLTWSDRFTQFSVGVCVSYFVSGAVAAFWALNPFVLQAVSFTIGMIAFRATPRLTSSLIERLVDGVGGLIDRCLPRKDRP